MREAVVDAAVYYGCGHVIAGDTSEWQDGLWRCRFGRRTSLHHLVDAVILLRHLWGSVLLVIAQIGACAHALCHLRASAILLASTRGISHIVRLRRDKIGISTLEYCESIENRPSVVTENNSILGQGMT